MSLTPKQARFVEEYLIDLNATQAAIRASYSQRTAEQQGARLLRNVKVAAAIQKAQEARSERTRIDQDWVIERLVGVYEASMEAQGSGPRGRGASPGRIARVIDGMSPVGVRRAKAAFFSGCKSHPATIAPAGSNRSSQGGDEMAEASGIEGHIW